MGKDRKNLITIDGEEYEYDDLTDEQKALFNHCVDLDRKISNAQFNLDQLSVGKDAFLERLRNSLSVETDESD